MPNITGQKHNVDDIKAESKVYAEKANLNFNDWRELEKFSLKLKQANMSEEANLFYRKAEQLFLNEYSDIDKDDLLFQDIDWTEYISFFADLKQASFTKLKAIRYLYTHGLAEGRLGKYLI